MGAILRIALRSTVPHPNVEIPVWAEQDHTAIVIGIGLGDQNQDPFLTSRAVLQIASTILSDHRSAIILSCVIHEKASVAAILGMECQA